MKITPADLELLRRVVAPLDTLERRERYRANQFPRADAVYDKNLRYRWDLLYASELLRSTNLFEYLDGDHVDTALRSIVPPL